MRVTVPVAPDCKGCVIAYGAATIPIAPARSNPVHRAISDLHRPARSATSCSRSAVGAICPFDGSHRCRLARSLTLPANQAASERSHRHRSFRPLGGPGYRRARLAPQRCL